jgi:hypothetical protein
MKNPTEKNKNQKINIKGLLSVFMLLMAATGNLFAQIPVKLGKNKDLLFKLGQQGARVAGKTSNTIAINISETEVLKVNINVHTQSENADIYIGTVENEKNAIFFLSGNSSSIQGNVMLKDKNVGYQYFSDSKGNTFVRKMDLDKLLCNSFDAHYSATESKRVMKTEAAGAAYHLESLPGAESVVLLDFDGQYVSKTFWNNGDPINAAPSGFDEASITEIWELVSEDYRPFQLNITTDSTVYLKAAAKKRTRCIFTPTTTAAPNQAGVSYVGSFTWGNETPCWVFNSGVKAAGEAASHEIGHTLGLSHDGRNIPQEQYFSGVGEWAPIMGAGYYFPMTQWSKGEYLYANNNEDDIDIITTTNGFGFRTDDYGNTPATAAPVNGNAKGEVSKNGVIEQEQDVDMFSFKSSGGLVHLVFSPATRHANLNMKVTLTDANNKVLAVGTPSGQNVDLSLVVNQGTFYVAVTGQGAGNPAADGFSKYASLGAYSISGSLPSTDVVLAVNQVENTESSTTLISVYPNPTKEKATIQFNSDIVQIITIELIDLSFRKIVTMEEEVIRGLNDIDLNLDNVNNGTYLVTVLHAGKKEVRKLIVLR